MRRETKIEELNQFSGSVKIGKVVGKLILEQTSYAFPSNVLTI